MKNVIIEWNKKIFDGTQRLLPDSLELFSYTKLNDESVWTVIFNFNISLILAQASACAYLAKKIQSSKI